MENPDGKDRSKQEREEEESLRSGKPIPFREETGVHRQRVDLPDPDPKAKDQTEEQPLLPHERDETTRPTATSLGTESEMSRDVVEQAREDTEHGLKDTDRRGIPSDIVSSDVAPGDRNKKKQP
jgi:hypothetical protein